MSNIESDRELLAQLKQDESNAYHSSESEAAKQHIAGAEGKLTSAIAQAEGSTDLNKDGKQLSRDVPPSGGEVDREALQASLHKRAQEAIENETGSKPVGDGKGNEALNMKKGSESARLQSAAEQYDQALKGKMDGGGESKY